jgi:sec-independent protein translocase protein TatC
MGGGLLEAFESPIFQRVASHIDRRRKLYLGIFSFGFVAGYPIGGEVIEWLLESEGYVPAGVEVIILQPLEVILLQLRIAAQIALGMMVATAVLDLAWLSRDVLPDSKRGISGGVWPSRAMMALVTMLLLGGLGLAYAHNVLIPFLLDYLAEDSGESGLVNTWQLQSWVGFVTGLYFSSIIGFQVPIVTILLLRSGAINRDSIVENRGLIWFAALFLGALISPPDPISLFLVGGPMLVLLEAALLYDSLYFKSE